MPYRITYDHETKVITRSNLAPEIVCTSWSVNGQPGLELWNIRTVLDWLDSGATLVGANVAYDTGCDLAQSQREGLAHEMIPRMLDAYDQGRIVDVQLDRKMLDIAKGEYDRYNPAKGGPGWSLGALAERRGREMEKEDWRKRYGALKGVPVHHWPAGAQRYALWDAVEAEEEDRINQALAAQLHAAHGWMALARHSAVAAGADMVLHLASCWGVCTDPQRTENLIGRVHAHMQEIRKDLTAVGLLRAQGTRDDKAACARMIEVMHGSGRVCELTKAGQRDYDAAVRGGMAPKDAYAAICARLSGIKMDRDAAIVSGDEPLIARADWISSNLLLGRAERMRKGHVFPLQTRFDSLKETFRTSSTQPGEDSGLEGEQMQNFPQGEKEEAYGLREAFTPRGIVRVPVHRGTLELALDAFVGADVSMAELHCLSEVNYRLFGWSRMGELLNSGVDLHWHFAASSIGKSYDEMVASGDKKQRSRAKPANFGFPGGMGPDKFILYSRKGYGIQFKREEVVPLKQRWLDTFPEMRLYLKRIGELCKPGMFTGVHPITGYVRGGCMYTDGANHEFQHLCAYAMKCALIAVNRACFTPGSALFGFRIWNFVHDEVLLEGPMARAADAAELLGEIIATVFNMFVPNFKTKADGFVTRVWSKKCEPVRGPDGRLLEWRPDA